MNKKIEPKLIDVKQIDRNLMLLFKSIKYQHGDPLLGKHKSTFLKQQKNIDNLNFSGRCLSLGKKLEILCLYGGYEIVKSDRKGEIAHRDTNNTDNKTLKTKQQDI